MVTATTGKDTMGQVNEEHRQGGFMRHFLLGRTLSGWIDGGRDNILQLRLLAALLVILGHSLILAGGRGRPPDPLTRLFPGIQSHTLGVMMFFVISGFLITLSWQRRPELWRFLRARFLRLWPGLATCVLAWALLFGPMLTVLPLEKYFGAGGSFGSLYAHLAGNLSLMKIHPMLPGVFTKAPVPHYANGSLWTIPVEAGLYLCVATLGLARLLRFPWLTSFLLCVLFGWLVLWPMYTGRPMFSGLERFGVQLAGFFAAGSIACLLRDHVRMSHGIMLVVAVACVVAQRTTHAMPFALLFVVCLVFWLAYVPRLPAIPRNVDASYGIYLWGFPTQQVLVQAGITNGWALFAVAAPIVVVIGTSSWLLVEKPCLRLKDWHPRRLRPGAQAPA